MDSISLGDVIHWLGYGLYLLGAILFWIYTRDQASDRQRIDKLEETRPKRDEVLSMIEAALYRDTRP